MNRLYIINIFLYFLFSTQGIAEGVPGVLEYAKKRSIEGHTKINNTQIGSYNNDLKFQLKQLEVENTKLKKSIEKLKLEIKESITYNEKITSEFDGKQKS